MIDERRQNRRRLAGLAWMMGGSLAVLILVFSMNNTVGMPDKAAATTATNVSIQKPPPKKKMPVKKREVRKPKSTQKSPRAPLPKIGGGLGGLSFGIPDFDAAALGDVSDKLLGDMDAMVMSEEAVDDPPTVRSRPAAVYPARARAKGITGSVTLSLLIDETGDVERVQILEASPPGVFDEAAREAVRNWRFDPASYKGKHVKVWVRQTVHFKLV
ncbi:energy transducer TonB [bacterium]|nr:energy transducer TonB [bacterium]